MKKNGHFDLSAFADVKVRAEDILARLQKGDMPCDGRWPQTNIDLFKTWISDGMQA